MIKEHVTELKWHSCSKKHISTWTKLLNRKDFKVTTSTRVCSNHFKFAEPFPIDPHPTLYLKGYDHQSPGTPVTPRRPPLQRSENITSTPRRPRVTRTPSHRSIATQVNPSDFHPYADNDHDYVHSAFRTRLFSSVYVQTLETEIGTLNDKVEQMRNELNEAESKVAQLEKDLAASSKKMKLADIADSDDLIKLYTGLPSYALFNWLFTEVSPHAQNMHYYKGSMDDKPYQVKNTSKPGRKRSQPLEDELLMTLMKLRLNLREEDLAFRFGVCQSTVSQVLSTWLPFLHKELISFINWPSKEETLRYYPTCFRKYKGTVRCIIDCTEVQIERPSLAASNSQVYSQYKSRPTLKCLVGISPSGAISYVSKPAGGNTSDKKLVKMSQIVELFEPGDICMADRGFNIQELFLHRQVRLVIPPFMRTTKSTAQFTESEDTRTKTVANARIHVERAIGRLKEFSILQGPIPLTMIDLMESALVVCSAIANLQPILVPLRS